MTDDDELIGLREDDVPEALRARQRAALADPVHRAAHDDALALGARIAALPRLPGPSRIHPRAARRRGAAPWLAGAGVLATAALGALIVIGSGLGARDRGVAGPQARVVLSAAAEGPGGLHPLGNGARIAADERVIFRMETSTPGTLALREDGAVTVWTEAEAGAGTHVPGGAKVLSWRPDDARTGPRTYVARLCTAPDACVEDRIVLQW